ncbi:MAG: hypothetical protein SF123_17625 [Chloroflexota bacterium]|nr:hypothetical protein [Chloroflexota bacterium]
MITPYLSLFRLALLLCTSFVVLVGVVRVLRPADDDLRALLLPPTDCAAPCWQGLRPGETSADDAEALLRAHPWVADINRTATHLSWHWNGRQPNAIDGTARGLIYLNSGRVGTLRIALTVPFGDIWALFKSPDDALLVRPVSRSSAYQIVDYAQAGIQVVSSLSCPVNPTVYWNGTTTLHLGEALLTEELNSVPYDVFQQGGWWRWLRTCRRAQGR